MSRSVTDFITWDTDATWTRGSRNIWARWLLISGRSNVVPLFIFVFPDRIGVSSTGGSRTFIPKLAKYSLLTIESRGSGSVNGEHNRRIYRKSGLQVPARVALSSRCLLYVFLSFFPSLLFFLFSFLSACIDAAAVVEHICRWNWIRLWTRRRLFDAARVSVDSTFAQR